MFGRDGLRVQQTMADTIRGVAADHVDPGWCARVARSLAPIRDVGDDGRRRAGLATTLSGGAGFTGFAGSVGEVWVASVAWSALGRPDRCRCRR